MAGNDHPFHQHFTRGRVAHGHRVDSHALAGQLSGLAHGIAQVLAAIADNHHAAHRPLGKRRGRQLHGRFQVGRFGIDEAFDPLGQLERLVQRGQLHRRVAAEDDYAHAVAPLPVFLDGPIHRPNHPPPLLLRDAKRLVQQVDDRHLVAVADQLRLAQSQHQQGEHPAAQQQRQPSPHRSQRAQVPQPIPPQQR